MGSRFSNLVSSRAKPRGDHGVPASASAESAPSLATTGVDLPVSVPEPAGEAVMSTLAAATTRGRFDGLLSSTPDVPLEPDPAEAGAVVIDKPATGRFGGLVSANAGDPASAKQAKINIAAVKALTPLVAAVSFYPGNAAGSGMKSAALATLITGMHKAASDVAMAMAPLPSKMDWVRGQVMQSIATAAAKQWETHGRVDMEAMGQQMASLLRNPSIEIQSIMEAQNGSDQYLDVDGPDVARARIALSASAAGWELFDWVTRSSLAEGSPDGSVFSYGRSIDVIVELLLGRVLDEARAMQITVRNADIRIAHLQGSIRRIGQLVGAEYVAQTRAVIHWINAEDIDAAEKDRRLRAAIDQFETNVLPRIMDWTHKNFAGIEHRARKLMEEFELEARGNEESSRPAA